MKMIKTPYPPDEARYKFTEGLDYSKTGPDSIWGAGYDKTLGLLKRIKLHGKWLNLAAGDGRYNLNLLKKADFVVASDIDESALSKLWHNTPKEYKKKLDTKAFDMTKKFPFEDSEFNGVFCTGILHLFPKEVLKKVVFEVNRILKSHGTIIFEFPANIKRISKDGKFIKFGKEHSYTVDEAKRTLRNLFKGYKIEMYETEAWEDFKEAKPPFKFSWTVVGFVAEKG